jgi:hypothetical protein
MAFDVTDQLQTGGGRKRKHRIQELFYCYAFIRSLAMLSPTIFFNSLLAMRITLDCIS